MPWPLYRSQGTSSHGIDPQSRNIPSPALEELKACCLLWMCDWPTAGENPSGGTSQMTVLCVIRDMTFLRPVSQCLCAGCSCHWSGPAWRSHTRHCSLVAVHCYTCHWSGPGSVTDAGSVSVGRQLMSLIRPWLSHWCWVSVCVPAAHVTDQALAQSLMLG